ncbi:unnamed protein product [Allacma fusca]|uniref:Transport and Golgi organization protein 2 n=1 Tax=Allacma fusca TaxID=39272 RepID=A0A8J2KY37_9HEXA|nr:unnamed protein product [Allacma fusca]
MCILFVSVNAKAKKDEYKLVLASNRDEFYNRSSLPAHRWEDQPHILGGMDMEPGREGGTWLGMNVQSGKIGVLLNITSKTMSADKRGRGSIVINFLNTSEDSLSYSNSLLQGADQYNPFNMVSISNIESDPNVTYFTNNAPQEAPKNLSTIGTYGFGNSVYEKPYLKVKNGRNDLEKLMQEFPTSDQESKLITGLLEILKSTERHYADPQLKIQAGSFPDEFMKGLSSRYVHIPSAKYGTRTHTIILVTGDNQGSFHEWTMEEPITNSNQPNWKYSKFNISLNSHAKI